jgi:hypothetical protein
MHSHAICGTFPGQLPRSDPSLCVVKYKLVATCAAATLHDLNRMVVSTPNI